MKDKSLRAWVYTATLIVLVVSLIVLTAGITRNIYNTLNLDENTYVLEGIVDSSIPVNAEVEVKKVIKPYSDETVTELISYYEVESDIETQQKSLVKYENTYMPNTGILYSAKQSFNVLAIYEGTVTNVETNETFGTIIEIKHDNNIVSKYSSLTNANVSIGDSVQSGEVIGTSGINKVSSESKNMLLIEVISNGEFINPNSIYDKELGE